MKTFPILHSSILVILLVISNGCNSLMTATSLTAAKFPWSKEDKPQTPHKMTAVWTHTVLNQVGKRGVRGFGGRLMFYKRKSDEAIKVEGTLTVYAFDESGEHHKTSPDRKYVFLPVKLEDHYSKSDIGHSYSIWIPWDEVGGEQKQISLITRFEPKDGTPIMSDNVRKLLPGIIKDPKEKEALEPDNQSILENYQSKVGLISHEEEAHSVETDPTKRPEAFTIDIPNSYLNRFPQHIPEETRYKEVIPYNQPEPEQKQIEEKEQSSSTIQSHELSDHFAQTTHSLQNQFPAQTTQGNQPSVSRAPTKRFRGWSPEPRPSVTQRFRIWQEQNEANLTGNLPKFDPNQKTGQVQY